MDNDNYLAMNKLSVSLVTLTGRDSGVSIDLEQQEQPCLCMSWSSPQASHHDAKVQFVGYSDEAHRCEDGPEKSRTCRNATSSFYLAVGLSVRLGVVTYPRGFVMVVLDCALTLYDSDRRQKILDDLRPTVPFLRSRLILVACQED